MTVFKNKFYYDQIGTKGNDILEQRALQTSFFTPLNVSDCTYKSPNLIMSSYDLSLTEHRIITLGCKKIKPIYVEKRMSPKDLDNAFQVMKFSNIEISVSEYKDEFNIKSNNVYDTLQKYCNKLYERSINYIDDYNVLTKKRWVSTCVYDRNSGLIKITFNVDMLPDLLVLKRYIPLNSSLLRDKTKSKYAYRNYEILKSNLYKKTWIIPIEEYKFLLKITDKYKTYGELNRKVIAPSIKYINEYTDINVKFSPIKAGNGYKFLKFEIKANSRTNLVIVEEGVEKTMPSAFNEISKALESLNIELTSTDAETLIDNAIEITQTNNIDVNVVDYILEKIELLKKYLICNKVDNTIGYLLSAIKNNWKINSKEQSKEPRKNGFNNFEGREYDYSDLEKQLLSRG